MVIIAGLYKCFGCNRILENLEPECTDSVGGITYLGKVERISAQY